MHHQRGVILLQMVAVHWFLLWKGVTSGDLSRYSIRMANNVTVQEGLCVTIPCNFTADNRTTFTNSTGIWRNGNNKVSYSDKSTKGTKPNFHAVGNPDNGDCTLTITDARKEDAGLYYFRFEENETSPNNYNYINTIVTVTVTGVTSGDPPGYSIRMANNVTVQEGLCVTIPCNFTADNRRTFTNSTGIWRTCDGNNVTYSDKSRTGTKPNFHAVGNPDNGDCTLTITDARKEDSGSYYFRFDENETSPNNYNYRNTIVTVTVTGVTYGDLSGYSIQMNKSVTVQEGLCVTIPCTFTTDCRTTFTHSIGMWSDSSKEYVAYSNKSRKGTKPNFHAVGNPDNGDCTLTITDARKEDAGSYHFRFEESEKSRNKYSYSSSTVEVNVTASRCMDNQIIIGIVIGNIFILFLLGLGVFCFIKRHVEKKKHRTESNDFQLHDATGTESVYQDLYGPTDSIYNTLQSAEQ